MPTFAHKFFRIAGTIIRTARLGPRRAAQSKDPLKGGSSLEQVVLHDVSHPHGQVAPPAAVVLDVVRREDVRSHEQEQVDEHTEGKDAEDDGKDGGKDSHGL